MHDPKRFQSSFQGRVYPREGNQDRLDGSAERLGDLCLSVGNLSDALSYYKSALAGIASENKGARLEVLLKVSACLRRQGKTQEALSFVEAVADPFTGRERRDLLAERATLLCLLGSYGDAARVCEEALGEEGGTDREKDAGIYLVLGHVLARLCKWKQSIVCLEQAATFGRMCGDMKTLGNALNNLGIVYKNLCRLDESKRFLKKAVEAARETGDDASLAVRLLNLANTLFKCGEMAKAKAAVSECVKITSELNIARTRTLALICSARIERARGDLAKALSTAQTALADAKTLADPRVVAVAQETLADSLLDAGDIPQARELLDACLADLPMRARDVEAEIKSRLAEVHLAAGRQKDAKRCAEEAAAVAEGIGDLYEVGRAFRVLSQVKADGVEASACLRKAEKIFAGIGARLETGITLYMKSRLVAHDTRTSAGHLKEAILAFRACHARRWRLKALCDLAMAYADMAHHEQAVTCLDEARAISHERPDEERFISQARVRIDSRLSHRLTLSDHEEPASLDAAFGLLTSRLGTGAMCLLKSDPDGKPRVVRAWGMTHDVAAELGRAVAMRETSPVIVTDAAGVVSGKHSCAWLGSLIGIRWGKAGGEGLLIACWKRKGGETGRAGPCASLLVKAYYEACQLVPVFERAIRPPLSALQPICIAGMVTADRRLKETLLSLQRIAEGSANVLITGETGTGKELVARAIHTLSPRRDRPFVVQNCAALPEQLLESELFGHKAGAFTGARGEKKGLLEVASGGTFFLDEVGDVSGAIQAKMLRAIESGEIRRLGDTVTRPIDTRFISATNKNLDVEVEQGRFRRDLYYRLNVVSVFLPPLRERDGDVEILTRLFLRRFAIKTAKPVPGIADDAMRVLATYDWPGNIRQLENELEKAVTLVGAGRTIDLETLSPCVTGVGEEQARGPCGSLKEELRTVERRRIVAALRKCGWNKTHAARLLGDLSRPALIGKMKRLGIPLKPS